MSRDELHSRVVAEIEGNEIDSFVKQRTPFIVRRWLTERLKRDDPVWRRRKRA